VESSVTGFADKIAKEGKLMLRHMSSLVFSVTLLLAAGSARAQEKADVKKVKYDGLADVVVKNRGKVVLVDFWHTQ
jgi:hypothetical protein